MLEDRNSKREIMDITHYHGYNVNMNDNEFEQYLRRKHHTYMVDRNFYQNIVDLIIGLVPKWFGLTIYIVQPVSGNNI